MIDFNKLSPWTWIVCSDSGSTFFKEDRRCKNYYALMYFGEMTVEDKADYLIFPIVFDLTSNGQSNLKNILGPNELYKNSYSPGDLGTLKEWMSGEFYKNLRVASKKETELLNKALIDLGILINKENSTVENTSGLSVKDLEDYLFRNVLDKLNP